MPSTPAALQHVLILGSVWPEPTSSAAGVRMTAYIEFFREWMNAKVTFCSAAKENAFTAELRARGVPCFSFEANDSRFDAWVEEQNPDLVFYDRFIIEEQFGWRIQSLLPHCIRVLDTEDLHSLRRARQRALEQGTTLADIFANRISFTSPDLHRELASIYRSDLTVMISDFEMNLLTRSFGVPEELLHLTRMYYPHLPATTLPFADRAHFAWIGNFRHPPNADALLWICESIWPLIRAQLPAAEFHLYGAYPLKNLERLHQPARGVHLKGPCENAWNTLQNYRVSLCPLRFGAGIKGKIADSWYVGTPVVTTPIGSEGMTESLPFGGIVAQTPESISQAAIDLYSNSNSFTLAQTRGFDLMRSLYAKAPQFEALRATLDDLIANLSQRRDKNTVGNILWLNTLRSTEYFSRWIEEKNRTVEAASPPA